MDQTLPPSDHDILIRLDEKVDGLHKKVDILTNDHEDRLRTLEKEANKLLGKQSIIGGLIGIGATILAAILQAGK